MSFITTVVGGVDVLRLRMLLLLPLSSSFEATSFLSLWPLFLVDDDDDDDDDDASPTALNGRFLFAALNISDVVRKVRTGSVLNSKSQREAKRGQSTNRKGEMSRASR
jgi:hypothetical protein